MSVPTGIGNYPAGVTDNDPHFEDDYDDDLEDDEWVLDCGLEGCLMPGYHFRKECHTIEMLEASGGGE